MNKLTLVLGASTKEDRYSNKAIKLLRKHLHDVIAIGRDTGRVADIDIQSEFPESVKIDTLTLYVNPAVQKQYYERILKCKPSRIIFNPGSENLELERLAENAGIKTEEACTLVLLNTGQY
ncbi:MAG: CoA-binding protein [Chitinophagales bacterium]|nr:CoA-binding protein [Chitinophagales bacterium]MCO5281487.1 CoA-binding protein [Chitinophagales bacterium]OJV28458.1 MAG: CoA-binding protein [Bacteroidetes bacterium 37-13]HRN94180.1 CoA-binding protein [Chitinophagales bacterium]HRP38537.1 CoA-binding protein [Chitinophagales bacterium]